LQRFEETGFIQAKLNSSEDCRTSSVLKISGAIFEEQQHPSEQQEFELFEQQQPFMSNEESF